MSESTTTALPPAGPPAAALAERPAIILIVDDEPRNRKLLETILRREGYDTVSAANGEEALPAIAQRAPDLILLDIKLPGMDGYQVARALKRDPGTSSIPIIVVTVLVDREARLAALNAGVEELLTKPIDSTELLLRVRNLLRLKAYGDLLENHSRMLEQKVQARTADLRASEQHLRTIIETDPECVKVVTGDMVLLDMNPAGLAMLEADSLAEAQAHPLIDFIVPEYRAAFADLHARVMRGESGMVEFQAIGLKGGRRWLETHAAPLGGGNGKAANLLGITRDITPRKKTDELIKRGSETLRRFSAAMDATADAIYLVDRSTMDFVYVNEAACRMQGLTREELLALGPARLLSLPRVELERIYDSVIAGGVESAPLEMLRSRKDGSQAWVELRRHAQRSGDTWTIVTLVRDITERKQAQQSVLQEKDFINAMLDSLPGLFYLIDSDGRFIRWNTEFERVSGYSSEEVSRLNPTDLFAGADKELVAQNIRQVFVTGEAVVEAGYVAKNGTRTPYIFTGKRVQFSGKPHLIGMGIDIAERKLADERIRRLNRVYAVLSGINSAIVRIREHRELFREVCRIAVAEGGFMLARVIEFDSKGQAGIAASTEVDTTLFQRIVDEYNSNPEHSNSMLALALRDRQPIFSNDVATDPRIPNRAALTEKGTYALALLPLFVGPRLAATVILRAQDAGAFNADENRLLLELTANISLALEHIEQEERLEILAAERRRDQDELQRFRAAMDHSGDAIVLIDRASMRYIDVNQNLCDVTGRTRQELIGTTPMELLGQSRETLELEYDALIARSGNAAEITEGHYRRNDGSLMPIEKRRQAFRSEQGWIIVGTTRDITERKQAEQALRESERRFSDLLHNVQLVSVMLDREARITYCNEYLLQLTGWRLEEVVGQSWVALFIPPESGDLKDRLAALLAGGPEARHGENMIVTRSGRRRLIRWNNSVLRSATGEVTGTASIGEDITVQKLAETRIRRLNRVYAVLSGINTLIVRARDRDELFAESCRIAVEAGDFTQAWLGIVDSPTGQFRIAAAHGGIQSFYKSLETDLIRKIRSGKGLVARAMATLQPVVSNDTLSDPEIVLRNDPDSGSIRSIAVLPLVVEGAAVGVFTLISDTPEYFDDDEVKLLVELAGDISFAIHSIKKQEELDYLAYYDVLTGLANRRLFLERLAQHMRGAVSGGHKLALFFLDLERFSNINDSLGRPAGDAILKQVAEWLLRNVGDANLVARLGADHFAIVLPEVKQEGDIANLLDRRIRALLDHQFRANDTEIRITTKVGVALFPNDGTDADTLLKNAEAALKKAKATGERYLFYKEKMTDRAAGKLTLENQLREALDKEEFVLHYQPKVNLESRKLTSAEALIRWNNPRTGLVPPGQFIPILEETGLIYDVGRWALRKAIADYLRWRAAGLPAVRIAVNVSPLQLRNRGFVDEIRQVISIDPLASAGLELEITESLIMDDVEQNIVSLQAIRAMGVTIAIDDFGTGFSSLSYLSKLPVDSLKIDRLFVNDMTSGSSGLSLVSTIINLAEALKLKVVAEGVETEEQSHLLRLLRCDEMQGFLFSKPVPADQFEARFLATPVAA